MIDITAAIISLAPQATWTLDGTTYQGIVWLDKTQITPTEAEINAEVIRLQAVYDSLEYARNRKTKYDKLNQDEMRFDDLVNSTTTWQDAIMAIKQEYPKTNTNKNAFDLGSCNIKDARAAARLEIKQ